MGFLTDLKASRAPVAAFAAMGLFWGAFAALVPALKPQSGLSDAGFGLVMLVSTCGAVLSMWLAPRAEAHLGARALPLLGVLMAASFLFPGLSRSGTGFALAMLFAGAAAGLLDVVMNARVSALEAERGRPLMNLAHATYSLVYAASAMTAGIARQAGAAPAPVLTALALLALVLSLAMRAPRGAATGPAPERDTPRTGWGLLLPAGATVLIGFMAEQATEGWSALHLERNLGAGAAAGALGPALLGLTMGAGRLFGQGLVQRLAETRVIGWGATLAACGALLAAFAPWIPLAYAGFALLGLGASVVVPMAFAWAGARVGRADRARAIARLSVIGYAGFFLGPPLMGLLSEALGLAAAFAWISAMLLLIPLGLVPLLRRRP